MENLAFWSVAALLSLGVAGLLVAATLRARSGAAAGPAGPARDIQLYRDQLAEVDRDLGRGTLAAEEAQRARAEIARRLLDADRKARAEAPGPAAGRGGWIAAGLIAAAVAGGMLLYSRIGLPWYPDMPIAQRLAEADATMRTRPSQADWVAQLAPLPAPEPDADYLALMEKLRAAVDPATATDPRGLELLARNEAMLGNYAAAVAAQRRLIEVKGAEAVSEDHSTLAEFLIAEAQGYVSPEAEQALVRALEKNPRNGLAHYYSGLMFAQAGRYDRAFLLWEPLLRESPPEAPWVAPLRAQIEDVARLAGIPYSLPALKGPTAEDMAAAADMTPEDRQAMVEGMVAQLSGRLAAEGGTAAEWAQLIRALGTLGRADEAAAIYAEAKGHFAASEADLAKLAGLLPASGALAGLDLGEKTIGVAISDLRRSVATPATVIRRVKFTQDAAALLGLVTAREIRGLVLGLPLNMDGTEGPRVQSTRAFARNLERLTDLPIAFWDERLSTVAAERALLEADTSRKRRKEVIDAVAAGYILQGALDRLALMAGDQRR